MTPMLSGHFSIFGLVFFVLKSLLGIAKQCRSREKFAIVSLKLRVRILLHHSSVPLKMIKFNTGLSQILSKVFLSKNMQLELTKYCPAFTPRYSND